MKRPNGYLKRVDHDTPELLSIRLRNLIHQFVLLLTKTRVKYQIIVDKSSALLPDKPVIFSVNHTRFYDTPVAAKAISRTFHRRCYVLAGKQNLFLSDRLFFFLNGVIWVDRQSKTEMAASKDILISYLEKKQSIMWFPEGTWNLAENLLILPIRWGIIDVAAQAKAQIVPAVLDYHETDMTCHISFGCPIAPDETTDKVSAIRELRDTMATLRWEMWEKQTPLKRDEIDRMALKEDLFLPLREYPPLDWEYEQKVIFKPYASPQDAFAHLDKLIPCRENAFLLSKRNTH